MKIARFIEVDTLAYLSLEGMLSCMKTAAERLLHGVLERAVQDSHRSSRTSKFSFEREQLKMFS